MKIVLGTGFESWAIFLNEQIYSFNFQSINPLSELHEWDTDLFSCFRLKYTNNFFCLQKYIVLSVWFYHWCIEVSDSLCSSASSYDSDRETSGRSRKRKKSSRSRKVLPEQFMHDGCFIVFFSMHLVFFWCLTSSLYPHSDSQGKGSEARIGIINATRVNIER
jgi:hypothetical protein